jgi:DNA repair exonuclease SbcCD nuclease subunit
MTLKIALLSDFHFGHGYNSEIEDDSFSAVEEALDKAMDCDIILILGDIFDSRLPKTAIWSKALHVLSKPLLKLNPGIKFVSTTKDLKEISRRSLNHIPVIALHGNHERRGKDEANTLTALENAGLLVHLHLDSIVFEKDGRKVAFFGMSSVPERFAKETLDTWNPQPMPGCTNVLLLHQSIDPYVFSPLEPPSLTISNLPKDFDMILNGHIHTPVQEKIGSTTFVITGSTMTTQLERAESGVSKYLWKIYLDSGTKSETKNEMKIEAIPLEKNRKFFYEEVYVDSASARQAAEEKILSILNRANAAGSSGKKPIIKLKIIGKESDVVSQDLQELEKKYAQQAILIFTKELETPEITKKIEFLRNIREQKLSVEEVGLSLLKKNLVDLNFATVFDYEQAFGLLTEGGIDVLLNIMTGEQRTLPGSLKIVRQ